MALAALFNIPSSPESFLEWSFAHAVHHLDIINALYHQANVVLPQYMLDPFDPNNPANIESWTYLHQTMHSNQNQILGISGFDLSGIDWQDENARASWISLNANEHYQASNILGIG